ncbi:MAG: hypothetical protein LAO51_06795 [Acidobacteriia bacterium]|nr:hypothetical protein [Terriglobia bacterium]
MVLIAAMSWPLAACRSPRPDRTTIDAAVRSGLGFVASAYHGNSFDDPYLRYVYTDERLSSPLEGYEVTYRLLDAYFIVRMLKETGVAPGPAAVLFERAEALTTALVPSWRAFGIYNLRRSPSPGGIALDTYAILAWLSRDVGLARVLVSGLDGDGWLPANLYTGEQSFRLLADESWAARAVLVSGIDPPLGNGLVLRIGKEALLRVGRPQSSVARANLVVLALDALRDLRESTGGAPGGDPKVDRMRRGLVEEGVRLLGDSELEDSTLTLANLLGSLAPEGEARRESLEPGVRTLLAGQDHYGGWSEARGTGGSSGRVFTTLRAMLALATYRRDREP